MIPVRLDGELFYVYVSKRPGVKEFLRKVQRWFEVVIYTASLSLYADPLLDEMDPEGWVSYRLFREHCTFCSNAFVKDLSLLGRDLKDVIIVDNSPASYALQPENALPISTWLDDMADTQLSKLAPLLELFTHVYDVRPYIGKIVAADSVDYVQALKVLKAEFEKSPPSAVRPLVNGWVDKQELRDFGQDPGQDPMQPHNLEAGQPNAGRTLRVTESRKTVDKGQFGSFTPQYKRMALCNLQQV